MLKFSSVISGLSAASRWWEGHLNRHVVVGLVGLLLASGGQGFASQSYALDLTADSREPLPVWLDAATQSANSQGQGIVEIPLRGPEGGTHLAVTVVFPEKTDETLAASWRGMGDPNPFVLSANLQEGLDGVLNQRTFIVERALVDAGGTLVFTYSNASVAPTKVVLTWLEADFVLTDDLEALPALITAGGQQFSPQSLTAAPFEPVADKVGKKVVDAALIDTAESLDDLLQVDLSLAGSVQVARVSLSVLGLPLTAGISIFVNGAYAGEAQLQMPSLDDPGYDLSGDSPRYAGWRKADLTFPGGLLKDGENSLTFVPSTTDPNLELVDPSYLRNARLQVIYAPSFNP